jgi:translation initiation factor IF-1
LYEVEVEGARITAHAGGTGRNFIRLLVGDRVLVELMPRDLTRGRIVRKTQ